jgi:3-oxoacyl-[acyl-carrier protein] reductase
VKKPHAIVTGAARGIGLAITKKLVSEGFHVSALDIDPSPLNKKRLDGITALPCDVGMPEQVRSTLQALLKKNGTPWALVNNAGFGGPFHRIDQVSDDEWTRIFDINVRSVFLFCRELLPLMAAQKGGRIVNIASIQGFLGAEKSSTYSASKHAVIGYTRSIAAEWGPNGIACNAISPGYIDTAQGARDELARDFQRRVIQRTPSRRILETREVAELAWFLCRKPGAKAPRTGAINGAVLTIDGGITAETGLR